MLSATTEPPPVNLRIPELKEQLPYQLDHAAVALRHPARRAVFSLGAASLAGMRATLDADGFIEIQTPKIVASATETGANVFRIDYFGRPGYLAQSPQFYKQMMVGVFERVYEIGPVFRAEPHDTVRHLAEYVSLDVELGFIEDHFSVIAVARMVIAGMLQGMQERCERELDAARTHAARGPGRDPAHLLSRGAGADRARDGREERGGRARPVARARAVPRRVGAARTRLRLPRSVTGYPMAKRPFYTHPDPERPEYSNSFDLLFRGLELITGGQRLHLYEDYVDVLTAAGQSLEPYESYLEAFKHGMPPHGGFAIGWERWLARLVEAQNIRETTIFPRDINRIQP